MWVNPAKTAEPIKMLFGERVHISDAVHISATWQYEELMCVAAVATIMVRVQKTVYWSILAIYIILRR